MTYVQQTGGTHYEYGSVENQHWDLMDRWDIEYLVATSSKYIVRFDRKGTPRLDLEKSISYIKKQLACHPNRGCRRVIPNAAMMEWLSDNKVSSKKELLLHLVHVEGTAKALHRAITLLAEAITFDHLEYNQREMEIINAINRS